MLLKTAILRPQVAGENTVRRGGRCERHVSMFHRKGNENERQKHLQVFDCRRRKPQTDSHASPSTSLRTGVDGKAAPLGRVTYADLWDGVTLTYAATVFNAPHKNVA